MDNLQAQQLIEVVKSLVTEFQELRDTLEVVTEPITLELRAIRESIQEIEANTEDLDHRLKNIDEAIDGVSSTLGLK